MAIPFSVILSYIKGSNVARSIGARKPPAFISSTFIYKTNYLVVEDRKISKEGEEPNPVEYLYYPIKVDDSGPRIRFTKYPSMLHDGIVILSRNRAYQVSVDNIARGIIKHGSMISSSVATMKALTESINERNGTVAAVHEESAEESYQSQSPADAGISNTPEIDFLQYTTNPQAFWAI